MARLRSKQDLDRRRQELSARYEGKTCVAVCAGTGCEAYGAGELADAFQREIESRNLEDIVLLRTGCHGYCEKGPVVLIQPGDVCYLGVKIEDVAEVISETIQKGVVIERLTYVDEVTRASIPFESDIPFYKYQERIVLADNSKIDPKKLDDYIALGGYSALAKALSEMSPENVLEEVKKSNLRGRGGGGFPAGAKWQTTRDAEDPVKYVVVNADEGDPGAYMDRSILEGNPHSVLEGLVIGAYAIGSHTGFIYVRQEYPLALENTLTALREAEQCGLLGKDILGSGFDFDVKVHRGAGAFVSGESSALITAIEGSAGEPRLKYTRTSVKGLWEKPTNLNNVETWANVPHIIRKGADWFCGIGTEHSKGTKVFSLVGKVDNTGLVEVPMGTTLRRIIFDIGGGIRNNRRFKAVQTGGPSGGVLPEHMLDLPVDFDELTKHGSMMGSGGMIVMDEDSCMVDVARYFLNFLSEESCGKCVPCREGIAEMLHVLDRITKGEGKDGDIEFLEDIGDLLAEAALCALGTTAANPVLSTIRHFRDEYDAHIHEKCCPALVCPELISYVIDSEKCKGCGSCLKQCPVGAIFGEKKKTHVINHAECIKCGACVEACPPRFGAAKKVTPALKVRTEKRAVVVAGKEEE
ncbi:NADH-ubiquinone oxidoreductase-F iron-sulfur binding region domain-containing protein [Planctomycetota bacterium]